MPREQATSVWTVAGQHVSPARSRPHVGPRLEEQVESLLACEPSNEQHHRSLTDAELLQERIAAFEQGDIAGQRLEHLKDIAARVRSWADENIDFVIQARGEPVAPPDIYWVKQSHATIRRALEEFLTVWMNRLRVNLGEDPKRPEIVLGSNNEGYRVAG